MYSNRSEYSHSRQYSDKSSRHWDGYDDRRERGEPHRDKQRESHHKYGGDGHSRTERTSRSREYSGSPKRLYCKDSLNRERSRKSPGRRRMSSPDRGASEKKRQRFTKGDEDDYRYRHVPEDKVSRQSPESFSHAPASKDFKRTLPQEKDIKYRKTTQDSRHRYRHDGFTHRQQRDDLTCRSWDHSPEGSQSQDHPVKYFESDVTHQSVAAPEQKKLTNGFQRFLDVLNKGVNIAMLTKIVTQTSTEVDNRPQSPSSLMNTPEDKWSPSCNETQQGSHQATSPWGESEGSQRLASPQPRHRSISPKVCPLSGEKSDREQSFFNFNGRSVSPSVVENVTLTPEDEEKHKHMQDILQAIGMNLGYEELGQMSHRIQERLYGKKDSEGSRCRRGSRERDTRQAFSPRRQNRSSSSRSSFSPPSREYHMKKDSYSAQRDVTGVQQVQVHQAVDCGLDSSGSILQESEKCDVNSQENAAACQMYLQNPTYTLSEPSPAAVMAMCSPVNCSPLPYQALPPNVSHVGPGLFLPRLPPLLPYPHVPPLNMSPAILAQTRHLLPQHMGNPRPLFNLPVQPLNATQKSKTLSRPRCLQVIETKQPG